MIAVVERKHVGLRTFDGRFLLPGAMGLLERMEAKDRAVIEKVLSEPVEFMDNPMFHDLGCETQIVESFKAPTPFATPEGRLIAIDLFTKTDHEPTSFKPLTLDQETQLFVKMNYARYRVYRLLKARRNRMLTPAVVKELLYWRKAELAVRDQIAKANVPLVLAMAKKARLDGVELADLIGEGNMALLRSVDKFDSCRGFKFSTYACRAILKSFTRLSLKVGRYRKRHPVEFDPELEKGHYLDECRATVQINCVDRVRNILGNADSDHALTRVEKQVLKARFGIDAAEPGSLEKHMTLEEVGKLLGLSKERVRQIQNNGLKKLRAVLDDHVLRS